MASQYVLYTLQMYLLSNSEKPYKQVFLIFYFKTICIFCTVSPKIGVSVVTFADRNNFALIDGKDVWQNMLFTIRNNGLYFGYNPRMI